MWCSAAPAGKASRAVCERHTFAQGYKHASLVGRTSTEAPRTAREAWTGPDRAVAATSTATSVRDGQRSDVANALAAERGLIEPILVVSAITRTGCEAVESLHPERSLQATARSRMGCVEELALPSSVAPRL